MPALPGHAPWSEEQLDSGIWLPACHCAFSNCSEMFDSEEGLRDHPQGEVHCERSAGALKYVPHLSRMDLYSAAIAVKERAKVPAVGPTVDRRTVQNSPGP